MNSHITVNERTNFVGWIKLRKLLQTDWHWTADLDQMEVSESGRGVILTLPRSDGIDLRSVRSDGSVRIKAWSDTP